ncbi:DUF3285 domain-containing protein [Acaryochloris marina]|uniref:DUF3285 domain-containing protein n=1 Tax=Acaryochloris marina (strain MBIC 11017) TaxID=329726 RepID=B0C7S0_ACAM1|nr:DUF3285 domain-containing protein [Acaryochloris marina]ABW26461.1 conserved hypothetical protein [Acaryochloris marina MBIC11017]BDM81274.1 hypothetical protein AM10699_41410 [Acaryochloris marina MBIC10699]
MSSDPSVTDEASTNPAEVTSVEPAAPTSDVAPASKPTDSYTKLAMRNMVRKGRRSLLEFGLTTVGVLALLIGLSYLTR